MFAISRVTSPKSEDHILLLHKIDAEVPKLALQPAKQTNVILSPRRHHAVPKYSST